MLKVSRDDDTCSGCLETSIYAQGVWKRAYVLRASGNEHTCSECLETSIHALGVWKRSVGTNLCNSKWDGKNCNEEVYKL
jgi:hypothetical protein